MILDFSIGNYRSVNKVQSLSFKATSLVSEQKEVDRNNIVGNEYEGVLKTIGVYGPNGSGKSNILRGLRLFCVLVQRSLESEGIIGQALDTFRLTNEQLEDAGFFQMQLLIKEKKFRYGFTLHPKGTVLQEWLFGPAEKKETWYFKRTQKGIETNKEWFSEGQDLPFGNLRPDTLLLTFASAYNSEVAQLLRDFIAQRVVFENVPGIRRLRVVGRAAMFNNISGGMSMGPTNRLVKEGKGRLVLDWLKNAGLAYSNVNIEPVDELTEKVLLEKPIFDEKGNRVGNAELEMTQDESAGTRKLYSYIGYLYNRFQRGGVLVSDEIDNNFHPFLLQQFLRLFNDREINPAGAQLLFTSHDTNLMHPEILRRDQIYFTEKSLKEETILYSLADLKGIRNNADFARQYLAGFYGALPILEKYKNG